MEEVSLRQRRSPVGASIQWRNQPCSRDALSAKKRSVLSTRRRASSRATQPRSAPAQSAVRPKPVAALEAMWCEG